ncbi:MAG: helix-turn-helix transcriptional regulator [Bacteroidetes bacterium]|nr:helix-turn-helix transcriptional regulator [Bacteroidota bacterium]
MVCPRCIESVKDVFDELSIETHSIKLGEVLTSVNVSSNQKDELEKKLSDKGFELLEDNKAKIISQIKSIIIDQIHHNNDSLNINFSALIAGKLHQEYTRLSKLFSSVEGITIERFIMNQKIERVKEFLFYDELTLSEIAFKMQYSSVAHLSSQFKKETGMTPTEFRKMKKPGHKALDNL